MLRSGSSAPQPQHPPAETLASDISYCYCWCSSRNTKGSQRGRRDRRPRACSAPLPRSRHISEGSSSVCHVCVLEGHSQWTENARRYLQHCQNPLPTQIYFGNACVRFADASFDPRIPQPAPEADSPCELMNDDLEVSRPWAPTLGARRHFPPRGIASCLDAESRVGVHPSWGLRVAGPWHGRSSSAG